MDEPVTYECTKCGKKFVGSTKGKGHTVTIYCCGKNMINNRQKRTVKKNIVKKTKKK